jgi:hypothetical protein
MPVVAEVHGDRLVRLQGLTELGEATTPEILMTAMRRPAGAFRADKTRLRLVMPTYPVLFLNSRAVCSVRSE